MTTPSPNPDDVTTRLREEDLRAMIDGCDGVTPGPWSYPIDKSGAPDTAIFSETKPKSATSEHGPCIAHVEVYDAITGFLPKRAYEANAAHIARLDPQTVSAMASELLSLRRQLAERDALVLSLTSSVDAPPTESILHPLADREKSADDIMYQAREKRRHAAVLIADAEVLEQLAYDTADYCGGGEP